MIALAAGGQQGSPKSLPSYLLIGPPASQVAQVVAHKCAQRNDVLGSIAHATTRMADYYSAFAEGSGRLRDACPHLNIDSYSSFSMATASSVVMSASPWKVNIVFQTELIQSESLM